MKKILMVCLGNICRSPMAQGILEHKIKQASLNSHVDSAGTSSYHIGDPPDARSVAKCREKDIDISHLKGRQFTSRDFDEFDFIYVMDNYNYRDVVEQARNEREVQKVQMILNTVYPGQNMSVPDPYYGGAEGFENVYQLLDHAADKIIESLIYEQQ